MVRYLPPFETLKSLIHVTGKGEASQVTMSYENMQRLIRTLLSVVEVDRAFYLSRNPDVVEGIRLGTISSAQQHFIDHGYFEGRLPYPIRVDEAWYRKTHSDVEKTLGDKFVSGQAHFDGPGYSEGRTPFALKG
jgi:hypothetical protein